MERTLSHSQITMNIVALGPLQPDPRVFDWLISEPASVPYFDGEPPEFTLEALTDADEVEAQNAVEAFLALDAAARLAASPFVFQNYRRMVDLVGKDQMGRRVSMDNRVDAYPYDDGSGFAVDYDLAMNHRHPDFNGL